MLVEGGAHALNTRIRTRHAQAFGPFPRISVRHRALRPTIKNCAFVPSASERYQSLAYTDGHFDSAAASGNTAQIPSPPVVTGPRLLHISTVTLCSLSTVVVLRFVLQHRTTPDVSTVDRCVPSP